MYRAITYENCIHDTHDIIVITWCIVFLQNVGIILAVGGLGFKMNGCVPLLCEPVGVVKQYI